MRYAPNICLNFTDLNQWLVHSFSWTIIIYLVINELKTDQFFKSKTVKKILAVEIALFNHMIGNWGKWSNIMIYKFEKNFCIISFKITLVNCYIYVSEQGTRCRTKKFICCDVWFVIERYCFPPRKTFHQFLYHGCLSLFVQIYKWE